MPIGSSAAYVRLRKGHNFTLRRGSRIRLQGNAIKMDQWVGAGGGAGLGTGVGREAGGRQQDSSIPSTRAPSGSGSGRQVCQASYALGQAGLGRARLDTAPHAWLSTPPKARLD